MADKEITKAAKDPFRQLSLEFARARVEQGLTVKELADNAEVDVSMIQAIELPSHGIMRTLTTKELTKISKCLKRSISITLTKHSMTEWNGKWYETTDSDPEEKSPSRS